MEKEDILSNGRKIIQDPDCFMYGIDAVLLSHFVAKEVHKGDKVIDLGTGNGIIPLLLADKSENLSITGLEIQSRLCDMAGRSLVLNGLEDKIKIINGDLRKVSELFPKHSFNVVISNPPYMPLTVGRQNEKDQKALARHEILANLKDICSAADYLLHSHGRFFMIHRPSRLAEIICCLKEYKLEAKRLRLILPFEGEEPNLLLIEARKDAGSGLKNEAPLIIRKRNKAGDLSYTEEVLKIYSEL